MEPVVRTQLSSLSVVAVAATVLISCTGEVSQKNNTSQAGNQPPVVRSARILPNPVDITVPLTAQIDAEDPDRNAVSFRLKWFVNEKPVPGDNLSQLAPGSVKRGDRVSVEITPFDGTVEGPVYRAETVTVGNTPPVVTNIALEPAPSAPGDRVIARVEASDPDHDPIHFSYRWWKNQTVVKEGEEAELDTTGFVIKDAIRVEVTPQDEGGKRSGVSSPILVLGNSSPQIVSTPSQSINRDRFQYVVQAKDADGDPLTYSLITFPPGMTIDKATGTISWMIPAELSGTHRVRVVVEDGQGGSSSQSFDLTLAPRPSAS